MLNTLLCAVATVAPAIEAVDFFPLAPGTKWTYREEGKFISALYTDEVKEPVEIAGDKAFPVETRQDGLLVDTVYYRSTGPAIFIIAYDPKKPLPVPRPLFKLGEKREAWEYEGITFFLKDPVPLNVKGESVPKGKRKVLGKETECIEVKFDARMGSSTENYVFSKQTAIYAKGIGLVEMQEKTTVNRRSDERKLRLVDFEPAKS